MRLLAVLGLTLLFAAPAAAQTGGTSADGGTSRTGGTPPAERTRVTTVSDGSFTLAGRTDTILGRTARFRGRVPASEAGRTLTVERYDVRARRWAPTASTVVGRDGSFLARWQTNHIGRFRIRAVLAFDGAQAASASPELQVTVYRPAVATWYGPGFYGRTTACGQKMTRRLVGVAHKRLPCGTKVAVHYKGRSLVVPVVDRGPYRKNTDWDLTAAAARSLGFAFTDTIGAVSLREPAQRSR